MAKLKEKDQKAPSKPTGKKPEVRKAPKSKENDQIELSTSSGDEPEVKRPARLKEKYQNELSSAIREQLGIQNIMQIPRLDKIIVNIGIGQGEADPKQLDAAVKQLGIISGQKPVVTRARKSIAQFKIRQGHRIGTHVTLRGDRMYEFMDKLVSIVFPRVRDFGGLNPRSFDGHGNYSLGLRDQTVFPEIDYDQADFKLRGMDITICTTARTDEHARVLLKACGFPLRER